MKKTKRAVKQLHTHAHLLLASLVVLWTPLHLTAASASATQQLLLQKLWSNASVTHNFLIATRELHDLYESLMASEGIATTEQRVAADMSDDDANALQNVEIENDDVETDKTLYEPTTPPICVANTLHASAQQQHAAADSIAKLLAKLKNAKVLHAKQHAANDLVNVVSMQTRWAFNFQKRDTHKQPFHNTPAWHVYADTMRKDDIFPYAELPQLNASALELPLRHRDLKMLLLLPHALDGLSSLLQQLNANFSHYEALITRQLRATLVRVFMPKFKFTHKAHLNAVFDELAHNSTAGLDLDIGNLAQKTHIEVNEEGIGAVHRSTVLFWNAYSFMRATPVLFDINHPFAFIIRQRRDVLFAGHLARLKVDFNMQHIHAVNENC